jgi:hypothetical protein
MGVDRARVISDVETALLVARKVTGVDDVSLQEKMRSIVVEAAHEMWGSSNMQVRIKEHNSDQVELCIEKISHRDGDKRLLRLEKTSKFAVLIAALERLLALLTAERVEPMGLTMAQLKSARADFRPYPDPLDALAANPGTVRRLDPNGPKVLCGGNETDTDLRKRARATDALKEFVNDQSTTPSDLHPKNATQAVAFLRKIALMVTDSSWASAFNVIDDAMLAGSTPMQWEKEVEFEWVDWDETGKKKPTTYRVKKRAAEALIYIEESTGCVYWAVRETDPNGEAALPDLRIDTLDVWARGQLRVSPQSTTTVDDLMPHAEERCWQLIRMINDNYDALHA